MSTDIKVTAQNLKDKKFVIAGAARSGISAAKLLKKHGASVFVTENSKISEKTASELILNKILFEQNGHNLQYIKEKCDVLVVSPGISLNSKIALVAKENEIPIVGEIEVASWFLNENAVCLGITGTSGKSTTTHYAAQLFEKAGFKARACGNIGTPLSQTILDYPDTNLYSIELSSYQLETTYSLHPKCTVFLNLQNDHLARYGTMEEYLKAKWRLVLLTAENGIAIIDKNVIKMAQDFNLPFPKAQVIILDLEQEIKKWSVKYPCLPGEYNAENILCASLMARYCGISDSVILSQWEKETSSYKHLPHRLEKITSFPEIYIDKYGREKKILIINDSKSTNVEKTIIALKSFQEPIRLLIGGEAKGDSYLPIKKFLDKNLVKIYPFGKAAEIIKNELGGHVFGNLLSAAEQALGDAKDGDVILLSPACSSFDEFRDYEHRGDVFREWAVTSQK